MSKYLMAIDAGTGSVRAVIFDINGNQISVGQKEWTHLSDPRYPGSMNFDVEKNYDLFISCISTAIKKAGINGKDIAAVSSTSMREGIVLYDKNGNELWACANVDARAVEEASQLKEISHDLEKEIYEISGQTFALGALPRILWVKNNMPEVYEKVSAITMLNDWIIYRLTGVLSLEPSNGCTTGMFSLERRKWETTIAKKCGLKDDIYPVVNESGTVVGKVSKDVAFETGLSQECIVVSGGGDAQLGCVGVGVVKPGQTALFGGSFWQLEYNVDKPITDKEFRIRVNCHAVPGVWQYELLAFFPGLIMRWFRDAFCQLEKLVEAQTGIDAYYLMDKAASSVSPGSNGLMCTFSDVMNYISWKHAAPSFINFSTDADKFDKKVFYRAIMENAALVTLGHAKIVESVTGKYPEDIIFASGASKSDLWCSIVADVLGTQIRVPKIKEAAALGTAICAGVGAGIYQSVVETASKFCSIEKVYEPDLENHKIYSEVFDRWQEVYKTELENSDKGLTTHMWKAPGL
jgi:autoinducer 2 (AI-2) kinase